MTARSRREATSPTVEDWTTDDMARLLTCRIAADLLAGRTPQIRVATTFWLPAGETALTVGPARVYELRTAGDGSYTQTSGVVLGTGPLGLALLAGSLLGNAAGNARRRQQAEHNAQLAFRHQFDASIFVTTAGFIFQDATGIGRWTHASINTMQILGPSLVALQGDAKDRSVTWQIQTPWAELVFIAWALRQHPHHPQLQDGTWLHQEWLDYARRKGHDPGLTTTTITPERR